MKPITSQLTVPNRIEYLGAVVAYISELARNAGFDDKEIGQIQLAVEEAVTNVIRHGLELNPDESFTIVCEQSDSDLCIRIQEKGVPFDPDRIPDYSPDAPLEKSSGLGSFLMKKMMDEVRYINRGELGKEICLIKRLRARRIDVRLSEEEKRPLEIEHPPEVTPNFAIRPLLPEEAIEVSKCAYRAYGYKYAEYIYFPESIVEYNRNGLIASYVAVTDDGKLMGHIALKFAFPGASIAEIGIAFIKPAYRQLGLFGKLSVHIAEKGREMNLAAVMGRAVTSHAISQKMCLNFGFCECGIFLGAIRRDFNFKGLTGEVRQRESEVVFFKTLQIFEAVNLYPPEPYKEMVERIYKRMGIPFVYPDPGGTDSADSAKASDIRLSVIPSWNEAEILVADYGDGTFDTLRHMTRQLCLEKLDVIYLFLNMEDPRCAGIVRKCLSLGYFFAGVIPKGVSDRHALVLQFLNNLKMNYDLIKPYSSEAQELLRFIIAGAPESETVDSDQPD